MSQGVFGGLFSSKGEHSQYVPVADRENLPLAPATDVDRTFEYALDALPCNAMFCDRELILRYLNRSSRKTLRTLQQYLPVPVDQIVGKSIHIFHKAPPRIDIIMGAKHPSGKHQLPHKATIPLGHLKLDLEVEPMTGEHGEFIGAV